MLVYEIIPGKLYQRGKFAKLDYKLEALAELGVDIVVALAGKPDPDMAGLFAYYYVPMGDSRSGLEKNAGGLLSLAAILAQHIREGHVALVHCNAGRNRSGLLNALIARYYFGTSGKDALDLVREIRPNAIATQAFEDFLKDLPTCYATCNVHWDWKG